MAGALFLLLITFRSTASHKSLHAKSALDNEARFPPAKARPVRENLGSSFGGSRRCFYCDPGKDMFKVHHIGKLCYM